MLQNSRSDCLDRGEVQTNPALAAHEAETAAGPCNDPCPYEEEVKYHVCVLDSNHNGLHRCDHGHAW